MQFLYRNYDIYIWIYDSYDEIINTYIYLIYMGVCVCVDPIPKFDKWSDGYP